MNSLKRTFILGFAALLISSVALQAATPKSWEVKVRAAYAKMANKSDAFTALDTFFPANSISVEDKWLPEIDVVYAFTENWLLEVVLTIPQTHEVTLAGVGSLGTFQELPPTFSVIYEFTNLGKFRPYVSAGVNLTWIMDTDLSVADVELDLDSTSVGAALGVGAKYEINERWDLDGSIKWISMDSAVKVGPTTITNVQLDPWLFSLGASYRF